MEVLYIKGAIVLLAEIIGGLSIWFGFRLFMAGIYERGEASAEAAGVKLALRDYGPGCAFALFGAAMMIFAITNQFSLSTSDDRTTSRCMEVSAAAAPASDTERSESEKEFEETVRATMAASAETKR